MLYEPLPGSAAVILAQLGIIEEGQIDALGARTYDAESARLSLVLDDGRTVELERAMHLHTENGYAVRIRSRAGQTISRSFIHIDRDLGVRNLHNDRMVYIDDAEYVSGPTYNAAGGQSYADPSEAEIEAAADHAHESQSHDLYAQPADTQSEHLDLEPAVMSVDEAISASVEAASVDVEPYEDQLIAEPQSSESERAAEPGMVVESEDLSVTPEAAFPELTSLAEAAPKELVSLTEDAGPTPPTEMLEILPGPDVASIIYFHETPASDLEPPDATASALAPQLAPEAAPLEAASPEALASGEEPPPDQGAESENQAEISAAAPEAADPTASPENASAEPQTSAEPISPESQASAEAELPSDETITLAELAAADFTTGAEPVTPEPVATEPVAAAEPEPFLAAAEPELAEPEPAEPDSHPDYAPLHAAFTPAEAADFLFVAQTGTIHTYEHRQTFRYIHIDSPSGLFYDQTRTPISRLAALKRALTPQSDQAAQATAPDSFAATTEPETQAQAKSEAQSSPDAAPQPIHAEPELRVRSTYAARAAVKPEPAPESQLTPKDHAPSFDAFTRKHGSPLDRDSWRDRVAGLRSALRLGRNSSPNGSKDPGETQNS